MRENRERTERKQTHLDVLILPRDAVLQADLDRPVLRGSNQEKRDQNPPHTPPVVDKKTAGTSQRGPRQKNCKRTWERDTFTPLGAAGSRSEDRLPERDGVPDGVELREPGVGGPPGVANVESVMRPRHADRASPRLKQRLK